MLGSETVSRRRKVLGLGGCTLCVECLDLVVPWVKKELSVTGLKDLFSEKEEAWRGSVGEQRVCKA